MHDDGDVEVVFPTAAGPTTFTFGYDRLDVYQGTRGRGFTQVNDPFFPTCRTPSPAVAITSHHTLTLDELFRPPLRFVRNYQRRLHVSSALTRVRTLSQTSSPTHSKQ